MVEIVAYLPVHQKEIDNMMHEINVEFSLPAAHPSYKPNLPDFYWVVLDNNELIGTIALNKVGNYGVLKRMFLRKKYRGTGVSSLMLKTALESCTSNKLDTLYLGTIEQFVAAQKFYVKNGFIKIASDELPSNFPNNPIDTLFYVRNIVTNSR